MFLREYLYVDVNKVRGLAGQLYDGIPEKASRVAARHKQLEADLKFIRGGGGASKEESTERNLADSLFKDLESDLESLGLLEDVSAQLSQVESWTHIEEIASPGRILRITAAGNIFHPSQMSEAIVGMATAAHGLADIGVADATDNAPVPPKAKSAAQKRADRASRRQRVDADPIYPEDYLPPGETIPLMDVPRKQMGGMIRIVRGIFGEGVHLHLRPLGVDGPAVSARLELGRQFLDSAPEVLFARYGLGLQDWTIVGMVGQLGSHFTPQEPDAITNENDSVNRAKVVDLVGNFLGQTGGLMDIPQEPGFSIVPLAVYRVIGQELTVS